MEYKAKKFSIKQNNKQRNKNMTKKDLEDIFRRSV